MVHISSEASRHPEHVAVSAKPLSKRNRRAELFSWVLPQDIATSKRHTQRAFAILSDRYRGDELRAFGLTCNDNIDQLVSDRALRGATLLEYAGYAVSAAMRIEQCRTPTLTLAELSQLRIGLPIHLGQAGETTFVTNEILECFAKEIEILKNLFGVMLPSPQERILQLSDEMQPLSAYWQFSFAPRLSTEASALMSRFLYRAGLAPFVHESGVQDLKVSRWQVGVYIDQCRAFAYGQLHAGRSHVRLATLERHLVAYPYPIRDVSVPHLCRWVEEQAQMV